MQCQFSTDHHKQTVYIDIKDATGNTQTIVSNKIHPFFTKVNHNYPLPPSSEGHNYQGDIENAQWVDASNLKAGYQLLSENSEWQVVKSVRQTNEPLSAYNLTVNNDHTYFVTGSDSTYGVWVHNDCLLDAVDSSWAWGSPTETPLQNVTKHFNEHKRAVSAADIEQYMRKAEAFKQNLRGTRPHPVDGYNENVKRYTKNGRYIDLTPDGKIVSFGGAK